MPPTKPRLTTPDNSLWRIIKSHVSERWCKSNEELRESVEEDFRNITPEMLCNMSRKTDLVCSKLMHIQIQWIQNLFIVLMDNMLAVGFEVRHPRTPNGFQLDSD
ncbi:hypothetical protein ANN_21875 [Periplaneta americana]|uniref:Uncharacterized protein n=1 Tax=Periplaneta americana TaxID=6978 RepID=A0ABQ8S6K5_PERAM|nr:hypothetical protein ANN_21875 [Periplaneta americana]